MSLETAQIITRIYRLENEFFGKAPPELKALETVAKNLSREWVSATEFVISDDEDKRRQQSKELGRIHTLHADSEDRVRLFSGTIERRFVKDQESRSISQYRFVPVNEKMPEFKYVVASAILIEEELEKVTQERDEARAEVERLNHHIPDAAKMIRPEPSRLEIAAMAMQGFLGQENWPFDVPGLSVRFADALIKATKGGAK
jgi:hypothetical protein